MAPTPDSQATPARLRQFKSYVRSAGIGAIVVEQAWAEPWTLTVFGRAGLHGTSVEGVTVDPAGYGEYSRVASVARA